MDSNILSKLRALIEGRSRDICNSMAPGIKVFVIVAVVAFFGIVNIHAIFRAINNIGREEGKFELADPTAGIPGFGTGNAGEADGYQNGTGDFSKEQLKPVDNDTTTKE